MFALTKRKGKAIREVEGRTVTYRPNDSSQQRCSLRDLLLPTFKITTIPNCVEKATIGRSQCMQGSNDPAVLRNGRIDHARQAMELICQTGRAIILKVDHPRCGCGLKSRHRLLSCSLDFAAQEPLYLLF